MYVTGLDYLHWQWQENLTVTHHVSLFALTVTGESDCEPSCVIICTDSDRRIWLWPIMCHYLQWQWQENKIMTVTHHVSLFALTVTGEYDCDPSCVIICSDTSKRVQPWLYMWHYLQWQESRNMTLHGDMVAQLVERRPRDPMDSMIRGSNPVRSTRKKIEFFWVKMLCWLVGVPYPRVCTHA